MDQKVVIITGANSGIGKAASKIFASANYNVVMACRNMTSGKRALQEIKQTTENPNINLMKLDTSSFESIYEFTDTVEQKYDKLDVLINNAAYFDHGADYQLSENGIELTFATNVVGPYLLTTELFELLKKSDDPRILNSGSNIIKHFFNPKKQIDFTNLRGETSNSNFRVYDSYRDSKMALLMLTFKIARVYKDVGIKVNAIQINGAKMSKATLNKFTLRWRIIAMIQNLFFPPADFMADKYFEICTSDKFKDVTGKLINHKLDIMEPAKNNDKAGAELSKIIGAKYYADYAEDEVVVNNLWDICKEYTGVKH